MAQVITGQNKIFTPEGQVLDPNRPITLNDFVKSPPVQTAQLNKGGFQGDLGKVGDRPTTFRPSKVTPVKVNNSAYVIVGGKAIRKENLGINVTSSADQLSDSDPRKANQLFTKNLAENLAKEKLQSQIVEGKTVKESQSIVDKYGVKKTDRNILNTYFQKDQIGTIDSIPIQTEGGSDIAPRRTALLLENALITGQKDVDITFNPIDDIQPNVSQIEDQIRNSQKENLGLEPLVSLTPEGGSANLSNDQFNELQKQISDLVKQGTPQDFITDPNDPRLTPEKQTNLDIFQNPLLLIILAVIGVGVISALVVRSRK
jgi:hypothetical protein